MNVKLLIDAIVQQTTVLIAQLSTAAGVRAPLARLADEVFLDLARALEAQGVGRRVVADMFGMALRGYQKKVQRLEESVTIRDQTLWEALLDYIREHEGVHRTELLDRFKRDGEGAVGSVLRDLVTSGLVYVTGQATNTAYRATPDDDLQKLLDVDSAESATAMVWATVYHCPGIGVDELCARLKLEETLVRSAVRALCDDGRLETADPQKPSGLRAKALVVPLNAEHGWEAAVFDHFQSVASAIAAKIRGTDLAARTDDVIGGATLHFDIRSGHPCEQEVLGLLKTVRANVNELWARVCQHNAEHPIPDADLKRVCFYFGQNVVGTDPTLPTE